MRRTCWMNISLSGAASHTSTSASSASTNPAGCQQRWATALAIGMLRVTRSSTTPPSRCSNKATPSANPAASSTPQLESSQEERSARTFIRKA